MRNPIKRFELVVLRPIWALMLVATAVLLVGQRWWGVAACVVGLLYLGVVGSRLHPLMTARELSEGPVSSTAAIREEASLSENDQVSLLGKACTSIGFLVGASFGLIALASFGWHWYWGVAAFSFAILVAGFLRATLL